MFRLNTAQLLLRPCEDSDMEAVAAFRGDEQVMYFVTGASEKTEEITQFLERTKTYAQQQPQTQYRFAVVLTSNEQVIGGCGLDITDRDSREGEIGTNQDVSPGKQAGIKLQSKFDACLLLTSAATLALW